MEHNVKNTNKAKKKSDGTCPYAKKCGGCDYQGMENPYYYRHKVHAVFDCVGRGQIVAGVYKKNSHDVVDIESCQIES